MWNMFTCHHQTNSWALQERWHGMRLTNQWNHLLHNCDFKLNESKVLISMVDPIDENHYLVVVEVLNGNIFLFVVNEIDDLVQEHLWDIP